MDTSRKQLESDSIDNKYTPFCYLMFQNMYTPISSIGDVAKGRSNLFFGFS